VVAQEADGWCHRCVIRYRTKFRSDRCEAVFLFLFAYVQPKGTFAASNMVLRHPKAAMVRSNTGGHIAPAR
jgi:hypothetical protein